MGGRWTDKTMKRGARRRQRREKGNGNLIPEDRMGENAVLGGLLFPMGLLLYGWTVIRVDAWIVPLLGTFFFGFGSMLIFGMCTTMLTGKPFLIIIYYFVKRRFTDMLLMFRICTRKIIIRRCCPEFRPKHFRLYRWCCHRTFTPRSRRRCLILYCWRNCFGEYKHYIHHEETRSQVEGTYRGV